MNIFGYSRIIIIGNNGSGKSFLAKELSIITELPVVHLDLEFWLPNWGQPSKEEWVNKQANIVSKEKWIIEGNHTGTMELRFKAADLVILLDINRLVCLASVFMRNGKIRSDIPQYLKEKFDIGFFKMCTGLWSFSKTRKPIIMDLHKKYPDKQFFSINSRKKLRKLLNQWRDEKTNYINSVL
ncbi:topology modulation protein [Senegalia massiliensis]|uniref:topology modulation protein n=1 Tax=Senegalia massiliensis TaxID=1720316 RepID=UPI0013EF159C|nr:topology modulation protein [Senegalia massiliensis]